MKSLSLFAAMTVALFFSVANVVKAEEVMTPAEKEASVYCEGKKPYYVDQYIVACTKADAETFGVGK